jgi:hypothetical protein
MANSIVVTPAPPQFAYHFWAYGNGPSIDVWIPDPSSGGPNETDMAAFAKSVHESPMYSTVGLTKGWIGPSAILTVDLTAATPSFDPPAGEDFPPIVDIQAALGLS